MFSSSSSGFLPTAGTLSGRQLRGAGLPAVVIATAIQPDPCAAPIADHTYALGVGNKQDYAHAHGWELHLSADLLDRAVTAVSLAPCGSALPIRGEHMSWACDSAFDNHHQHTCQVIPDAEPCRCVRHCQSRHTRVRSSLSGLR